MPPLSSKEQKRIIAQAQQSGTLGDLYWMIELDIPLRFGGGKSAVKLEDGVPLIPVGPDIETSTADAELLRWGLEWINLGNGYRFTLALTDKAAIERTGAKCYVWGEENMTIDNICHECGQVHRAGYYESWGCCGWSQVVRVGGK